MKCYYSEKDKRFHATKKCPSFKHSDRFEKLNYKETTFENAIKHGLHPCHCIYTWRHYG